MVQKVSRWFGLIWRKRSDTAFPKKQPFLQEATWQQYLEALDLRCQKLKSEEYVEKSSLTMYTYWQE